MVIREPDVHAPVGRFLLGLWDVLKTYMIQRRSLPYFGDRIKQATVIGLAIDMLKKQDI